MAGECSAPRRVSCRNIGLSSLSVQILRADAPDFEARWKRLCARGSDEDEAGVRRGRRAPSSPTCAPAATRRSSSTPAASTAGSRRRRPTWWPGPATSRRPGAPSPRPGARRSGSRPTRIESFHRRETRRGGPRLPRPARRPARPGVAPARPGRALRSRRHRPLPVQRPHDRHPGPGGRRGRGGGGLARRPRAPATWTPGRWPPATSPGSRASSGWAGPRRWRRWPTGPPPSPRWTRSAARATPTWPPPSGSSSARSTST